MQNWKTTVGGALAALGIALRHAPLPALAVWSDLVEVLGVTLMGVSSADAGHVAGIRADVETLKANTTIVKP